MSRPGVDPVIPAGRNAIKTYELKLFFEELKATGGSLDGAGSPDNGYVVRGGRMIEEHYVCTYDLFASIPSLTDQTKSVKDEIFEFSHKYVSSSRCRLVRNGQKVDVSSFELSEKDRLDLLALIVHSEDSLGSMTSPTILNSTKSNGAWLLWEDIANGRPGFGHPAVFADHIDQTKWLSFTVTLNDPSFFQFIEEFTGNEAGTGGLFTMVDSNSKKAANSYRIDLRRLPPAAPEAAAAGWTCRSGDWSEASG